MVFRPHHQHTMHIYHGISFYPHLKLFTVRRFDDLGPYILWHQALLGKSEGPSDAYSTATSSKPARLSGPSWISESCCDLDCSPSIVTSRNSQQAVTCLQKLWAVSHHVAFYHSILERTAAQILHACHAVRSYCIDVIQPLHEASHKRIQPKTRSRSRTASDLSSLACIAQASQLNH
jgi:hypothetical protein